MTIGNDARMGWAKYIRIFVVISLFIQFLMLVAAPLRKRTKNQLVNLLIWLAYLAADWFATFVIGLILNGYVSPYLDPDLLVYWAPFLLVQLGGPDTITAYSFEDNELWARHLFEFLGQTASTGYLFVQSLDFTEKYYFLSDNELFLPTLCIYLVGIIKYGEKIRSLYLASLGKFRSSLQAGSQAAKETDKDMLDFLAKKVVSKHNKSSDDDAAGVTNESVDDDAAGVTNESVDDDAAGVTNESVDDDAAGVTNESIDIELGGAMNESTDDDAAGVMKVSIDDDAAGVTNESIDIELGGAMNESIDDDAAGVMKVSIDDGTAGVMNESADNDVAGVMNESSDIDAAEVMKVAFCLFNFFNRLVLDINFTINERDKIRDYFLNNISSAEEAFKILEIELNLFYEVLYTKVIAFHQWLGYTIRCASFSLLFGSLVGWILVDKAGMNKPDVQITYTLLIGELTMEIIASMGLLISDWMTGCSLHGNSNFRSNDLITLMARKMKLRLEKRTWSRYPAYTKSEGSIDRCPQRISRMLLYRWSGSIPQCSPKNRGFYTTIFDMLFGSKYYYTTPLCNDLMEFIFNELRAKAKHAKDRPEDAKRIFSARGEWTLANFDETHQLEDALKPYTVDVEYDERLLRWYLTTESLMLLDKENSMHRIYCSVLSKYMMYLIIKQPTLMSTVADIGESRYLDISQRLNRLRSGLNGLDILISEEPSDSWIMQAPNPLIDLGPRKWEIVSKVWLELLCYAAIECRPRNLISKVADGGELITFIWALMIHLGLGKQYRD